VDEIVSRRSHERFFPLSQRYYPFKASKRSWTEHNNQALLHFGPSSCGRFHLPARALRIFPIGPKRRETNSAGSGAGYQSLFAVSFSRYSEDSLYSFRALVVKQAPVQTVTLLFKDGSSSAPQRHASPPDPEGRCFLCRSLFSRLADSFSPGECFLIFCPRVLPPNWSLRDRIFHRSLCSLRVLGVT